MNPSTKIHPRPASGWRPGQDLRKFTAVAGVSLFGLIVLIMFLLPLGYVGLAAFKTTRQIQDPKSQLLPSSPMTFNYEGTDYPLYKVPTKTGIRELALVKKVGGRDKSGATIYESTFIDPANVQAGLIKTDLNWFKLEPMYRFDPTLANFPASWEQVNLGRLISNTLIIAILGTIGTLLSSIAVAYGFARFNFRGVNILFLILISTIILPRQVTLIPTYIFWRFLASPEVFGWGVTWLPLIVPHFFANAYNVFLLRQYFRSIPRELDEAAEIDGANPLQTLLYVIIPQSIPAILAVGLFHFFFAWNDFFEPLVYLSGRDDLATISIGMAVFNNIFNTQPGLAMAAALMALALPVTIFFLTQRVFMQGIVITGVEK
jgi:multiple sugar transport system permease protein